MKTLTSIILILFFISFESYSQDEVSKTKVSEETIASGQRVFTNICAVCHINSSLSKTNGPSVGLLAGMSPKAIYSALTIGKMKLQASTLSDDERKAVAEFITKKSLQSTPMPEAAFTKFSLPEHPTYFSGYGGNLEGTGFINESDINASNVSKLKVKWVFAFPEGTQVRSKPAVVGDWLIMGSQFGNVYCINKKTGKIGWHFQADAGVRGAVAISGNPLKVYFADYATNVYVLDLKTGALIWKQRSGVHPQSAVTGSVAVFKNTIVVPITSFEVLSAQDPNYDCCTSSGEMVALDTKTGKIIWRHRVITEEAKVSGKKSNGKSFYGPSGAIVWGSPNIDTKRGLVYFGTGENYTEPATKTSDAIQALDLKTGKLIWTYQSTQNDTWNLACPGDPNCPEKAGPDLDFGMAPIIVKGGHDGKDVLIAGQKSGVVHALEPETGKIIWQTRIGKGGALGGIHWGMAVDGKQIFAANADNIYAIDNSDSSRNASPGLYALDIQTGKINWSQATPAVEQGKIQANSAAPLALSEIVFAGALDGHIRAYDKISGNILWDFDTVRKYETVNGIAGKGGSLDGPSPVVSDGILYVNSGYGSFSEIPGNVLIAFEVEK
ncbi:dehydrogenase [Lacihabitans sp. LS3-19]|uniref:outer membrane protein assembly factor BamB family protein n=1 Tax=Lacihabitans sp. LS3-19 TaxID=2487335 RepID=UPI0020CD03B6|nr:PQQ-binding-like beta-propeller repeat protein [Lacihabitans sp. LS3-19]MCP9770233.1 dehydrogenase [Lacihabitans sp. LS3-19]